MENSEEIKILKAGLEHTEQVLRLLKESFIPREPLAVAVGFTWEDFDLGHAGMEKMLNEGCSFVALNSAGRVVGCRLSEIKKIDRNLVPEPDYIEFSSVTEGAKRLQSVFRSLMAGWTKELPESKVIMEFFLMCVEEQYTQRGIAKRLVEKSLALAEELQVDYVYTIGTTWKSQRVFDKLQFTTVRTKDYDDFVDAEGRPWLKLSDGTTSVKWMVKKIKK